MISPGNFSPAVRDPRVLNDLFAVNEPLNDDDSFSISNYSDDPLTKTDCKYSSAENFEFFPTTNNAYIFSTFCLNLRSLCNPKNLDNLKCVLESMSSYPTVIGITETWLKENSRDPCTELSNYTFSSKCRSKSKGGGVGLFVCKNLTHWLRATIYQCLMKAVLNQYLLKLTWVNLTLFVVTCIGHPSMTTP